MLEIAKTNNLYVEAIIFTENTDLEAILKKLKEKIELSRDFIEHTKNKKIVEEKIKKFGRKKDGKTYSDDEIIEFIIEKNLVVNSNYTYDLLDESKDYDYLDMDKITYELTGKHRK